MARPLGIGKDIISLRLKGYNYNQIARALNCAKGTVQYHCEKQGLTDIGYNKGRISPEIQKAIFEYAQHHTKEETAEKFMVSLSTVKKYAKKKPDDTIK